jgi:hypothetical protein
MNPPNQFGSAKPVRTGEGTTCAQCEAMLPDWMDNAEDGELTAKDRAAFELHIATCAECSQMLADAQRGAALLEMLKSPRPEPSSALLDRILANTSGLTGPAKSRNAGVVPASASAMVQVPGVSPATYLLGTSLPQTVPGTSPSNVLPFRSPATGRFNLRAITHTMMQPRLAMTAAMAFFSIALTLNLTGVHLNELSVSDLKPSSLRRTFYQTNASIARYYDNLRVVYELESRVQDLKRSSESDGPDTGGGSNATGSPSPGATSPGSTSKSGPGTDATQDKQKQDQPHKESPKAGSGTSQRRNPMRPMQENFFRLAASQDRSLTPRQAPFEPFRLTSSTDRRTLVMSHKFKKQKQEGVLA